MKKEESELMDQSREKRVMLSGGKASHFVRGALFLCRPSFLNSSSLFLPPYSATTWMRSGTQRHRVEV